MGLAVAVVTAPTAILELRHSCAMRTRAFSFFARPSLCHNLIRGKPETILHSLGPSFDVSNNDAHPLRVGGGLWHNLE